MTGTPKIRVGVVAADPLRVLGLVAILEDWFDLEAIGLELEAVAKDRRLAALLIDVHSCRAGLTDVIARLRADRGDLKIIVIGVTIDPAFIQAVIGAGARGYLLETSDEREIRMAIEVVLDGSVWAPRKVLARLRDTTVPRSEDDAAGARSAATADGWKLQPADRAGDGDRRGDGEGAPGEDAAEDGNQQPD
jgi:DNA-binding NarL/FixJ family response regulator